MGLICARGKADSLFIICPDREQIGLPIYMVKKQIVDTEVFNVFQFGDTKIEVFDNTFAWTCPQSIA